MTRWALGFALALCACNPDPGEADEQVGLRVGLEDGEADNGERGNIKISEVMWSGSVTNDGTWDATDVFIELRNEGSRAVNVSGWFIDLDGSRRITFRIPDSDFDVLTGEHRFLAAKASGCFPNPDWVVPDLAFPYGDPIYLRLRDRDERLIEPAGNREMEPYAGGYDLVTSRSMEKIELMFGGNGTDPSSWHHYTEAQVDVPNRDKVAENCRGRTLASPGRPNSPDYSGAFSSGSLE